MAYEYFGNACFRFGDSVYFLQRQRQLKIGLFGYIEELDFQLITVLLLNAGQEIVDDVLTVRTGFRIKEEDTHHRFLRFNLQNPSGKSKHQQHQHEDDRSSHFLSLWLSFLPSLVQIVTDRQTVVSDRNHARLLYQKWRK